ncbi:MAG: hypothetical protein KME42_19395 [Tildeniella nuda ZEHNDER 1965/U140]|jgi:hypothetical protein|nr:hypothetical protein [Tildeniella nuda ZEHNDER 1965/U140]
MCGEVIEKPFPFIADGIFDLVKQAAPNRVPHRAIVPAAKNSFQKCRLGGILKQERVYKLALAAHS